MVFLPIKSSPLYSYFWVEVWSNISKLFEHMMFNRLESFLRDSNILYNLPFGFRKNHSTNHALLNIVEDICKALDSKSFVCAVCIDLEKAFDTVNHQILLSKLYHYGIRGVANKWLSSYLLNRYQKVSINGESSPWLQIKCGVPQGSILGPLLFLIYINDMNTAIEFSKVYHFADNTSFLYSCKNLNNLRKTMNKDLNFLYKWLCVNRLSMLPKQSLLSLDLFQDNHNKELPWDYVIEHYSKRQKLNT